MSDGKEAQMVRTSLRHPYPSPAINSSDRPDGQSTEGGGTQISLWLH